MDSDIKDKKANDLLRRERELRGWTQQKVAEAISADMSMVSRWERGERKPDPYYREKLCALFGKDAEELGFIESQKRAAPPPPNTVSSTDLTPQEQGGVRGRSQATPSFWNVPYQRNPYFTGRDELLQHLHDALSTKNAAALTHPQRPPQAICGLGGIGK